MKIIGIGCDIVQIHRIKTIYSSQKEKFLQRIFSQNELSIIPNTHDMINYIAKRYAAKEAFSKAAGCGIGKQMKFCEIEVFRYENGQPYFSEKTLKLLGQNMSAFLSLSDDDPLAIAYVILCKNLDIQNI